MQQRFRGRVMAEESPQSEAARRGRSCARDSGASAAMRNCGCKRFARQNPSQSSDQPFACGLAPMKLSVAQPNFSRDAMLACERFAQMPAALPSSGSSSSHSSSIHASRRRGPGLRAPAPEWPPLRATPRAHRPPPRTSRALGFQRPCANLPLGAALAPCIRARPRSRSAMRSRGSSRPTCNRTSGPPVQGLAVRLQCAVTPRPRSRPSCSRARSTRGGR